MKLQCHSHRKCFLVFHNIHLQEKLAYVALDYAEETKKPNTNAEGLEKAYELPDGQVSLSLQSQIFQTLDHEIEKYVPVGTGRKVRTLRHLRKLRTSHIL